MVPKDRFTITAHYQAGRPQLMIKSSTIFLILSFLFSCASNEGQKNNNTSNKGTGKILIVKKDTSLNKIGYYKIDGDSLIIPSFDIEVCLTQKANKKLKDAKETIIVSAYFIGQPKDTTSKEYLESGEMGIGSSERELSDSRITKFENIKFSKALYDSLADKDIQLLINIYSGRKSTDVNLLDCDILQDKMSNIKGKRFKIKGKLIGERGSLE